MNKKLFMSMAILMSFVVSSAVNSAFANPPEKTETGIEKKIMQPKTFEYFGQVPPSVKDPATKIDKDHHMKFHNPDQKAAMAAKKAEFENRLKLTDKQKEQIEADRKKDHEKVKPIFEDIDKKRAEIKKIKKDPSLTQANKDKKIEKLRKDIKKLKQKTKKYHAENMKKFESILTEEQKVEFNKIKAEQKLEMQIRRAEFQKRKNSTNLKKHHDEKGTVLLPKEPKEIIKLKDVQPKVEADKK